MINQPISIILDTDIGDDIDDALALTVALNSPEIRLVGVTTVFRDAPRRAILARHVLELLQAQHIPVFAGCSQPLLPDWDNFPGGQALGRQFEALDPSLTWDEPRHAVDFIIQTVREFAARNEMITLVPIGPLTNIALAFHLAPDLVSCCRVVLMGGIWSEEYAEWNIRGDPEAAAIVFNSGADISMVGLDVTLQCVLDKEQEQRFRESPHPHAQFLAHLIEIWAHPITLHDPLTVLSLFSDVVSFEPRRIEVALHEPVDRARTIVKEGAPTCRVATQVDVARAQELFMKRALAE